MTHLENRFSSKTEVFLNYFNIEWQHPYGYVRDWNGEGGLPCSVNFIQSMEKLMYKYQKSNLTIKTVSYWDEKTLLNLMNEVAIIYSEESLYRSDTNCT